MKERRPSKVLYDTGLVPPSQLKSWWKEREREREREREKDARVSNDDTFHIHTERDG